MKTARALIAAACLTLASTAALAQVTVPPQPQPGPFPEPVTENGGLTFIAYDPVAGRSLTLYLGLTLDQILPSALAPAAGLSLDFGVLTGWASAFAGSNLANIRWHVTAGDQVGFGGGPDFTGAEFDTVRLATTLGAGVVNPVLRNNALLNSVTNVQDFLQLRVNDVNGCNGVNPCVALQNTQPYYAGLLGNQLNGPIGGAAALPFVNSGTVGSALQFFLFSGTGNEPSDNSVSQLYANSAGFGTWLLDATGSLSWNVTAIPLPAAVWLLLSGLCGMVTLSRRRVPAVA